MKNPRSSIWDDRDLVIFDLDGTLYDQTRLRARMALALCIDAMRSGTLDTLKILQRFRLCRETLARTSPDDFIERQFIETAALCGCTTEQVERIVADWIDKRPLRFLGGCRYPGIDVLFDGLRRSGRTVAILSDYSARDKLGALGLEADLVVTAMDDDVRKLKPHPAGLQKILHMAGVPASHALMVGDRFERDWAVANRIGMDALIRSTRRDPRCATFRSYRDALFEPVLSERGRNGHGTGERRTDTKDGRLLPNARDCVAAITDTLIALERPDSDEEVKSPTVAFIMATQAGMPDYLRAAFRVLTVIFDAWPLPRTGKTFHRLDLPRRMEQIRRWEHSRLSYRQALVAFYRSFTTFGVYSELCKQDTDGGVCSKQD